MGVPVDHEARMARARLALDGLSVGDAFGQRFFVPAGIVARRVANRTVPPGPWRYTDDTEMALSIVEVLGACGLIDQDRLAEAFARRFDPSRGYGGMAQSILNAIRWGQPWREASRGAFGGEGSMGNGGAMRVAPVGGYFADDLERAAEEAHLSAEVTHAHPEGQAGAAAIAVAAALAWQEAQGKVTDPGTFIATVADFTPPGETRAGLEKAVRLPDDADVETAAAVLGSGSRVTALDTAPFTIWCAARFRHSYEDAIWSTVSALGDRDTTCAIVGGIVALAVGRAGIPEAWLRSRESLSEG